MSVLFVGGCVLLPHLGFPMEFVKEAFSLLFFLRCIWMACCLNWLSVVLVVTAWGNLFAGCLCYADDIVLLAPCPSPLRMMLQ